MKINCLVVFTILLLITGCDGKQNLATLCENHPKICEEFKTDSWCKSERAEVAFNNLAVNQHNKEIDKYYLLLSYEDYATCMAHASKIDYIKYKDKRTFRIENLVKATKRIDELNQQTQLSSHPELLYYHWSRNLNENSLTKFLALEGSPALNSTESQFNLATYYSKRDPNKTIKLLYKALELYRDERPLNPEIFKALSTIFEDKRDFDKAYIWSRILYLYQPDDKHLNDDAIFRFKNEYNLDISFLDKVADVTYDKIQGGEFVAPKV